MPIEHADSATLVDVTVQTPEATLGPWTLTVSPGEVVALTGDNGAGKSSLLRVLCGQTTASTGTVRCPLSRSLAPEPFVPPTGLRTQDLICHLTDSLGASVPSAVTVLCSHAMMIRRLDELSRGQLKRVVVAQAFIGRPSLLLLDEPLEGLDRSGIASVTALVHQHVQDGGCALIATHRPDAWAHAHTRVVSVGEP